MLSERCHGIVAMYYALLLSKMNCTAGNDNQLTDSLQLQSCSCSEVDSVVAERAGIDKIGTLGRHIEEKTSAYPEHSRAMEHTKTKQPVSTDMKPTEENSKTHLIGEEEHPLALNRALSAFVSVQ